MRIFIISLLALASLTLSAQGGLTFSQVLNPSGTLAGSNTEVIVGTVPAGKVWKVTSVGIGSSVIWEKKVGATAVQLSTSNGNLFSATSTSGGMYAPVWLREGETIQIRCLTSSTRAYYFSIIEFNVN